MEQQALLFGEPLRTLPRDLYIPPDALRVLLMSFEGPLDILLYLIRKNNVSIHDIPVAEITAQYLEYIALMQKMDMNLAAEYLCMAATLTEIKARLMLPQSRLQALQDAPEEDPREELSRQLALYAATKQQALQLEAMPRVGAGLYLSAYHLPLPPVPPEADTERLLWAMAALLERQSFSHQHEIINEGESLSLRLMKMEESLSHEWRSLSASYQQDEGVAGVVLSLMAMLELDKAQKLSWKQERFFEDIFIMRREDIQETKE